MNIEQHQIDPVHAELSIRLEPSDYNERFENALKNYRKTAQLPGFRPGHVPVSLIRKRFGKALLAEEINSILQEGINRHIAENKLLVLGAPLPKETGEVGDWESPAEFSFTYELGLAPAIDIQLDASQHFVRYRINVTEEMLNRQMKDYARQYGKLSQPEISGAEDLVTIELFEVDESGAPLEGGLTGSTRVYLDHLADEGIRNSLTGSSIGTEVSIDPMKITHDHDEIGKIFGITHHEVHHLHDRFKARVKEISRIEPAEYNEELFNKILPDAGVTDLDTFRDRVKTELEGIFNKDTARHFEQTIWKTLVDRHPFSLPDTFLKKWISTASENPVDAQTLEHDYPRYADSIRWDLLKGEIIRKYELKVNSEDALDYVKGILRERFVSYGINVGEEELTDMARRSLGKSEELRNIYDTLMDQRIASCIEANCTIEEKVVSYEEFVHILQH